MIATPLPYSTPAPNSLLYKWLGSFWSTVYTDEQFIRSWTDGHGLMAIQIYLNFLESINLLGREDAPVFHRERWMPIILKQSQKGTGKASSIKLGMKPAIQLGPQDITTPYEPGVTYTLGGYAVPRGFVTYPINKDVYKIATIMDRIIDPTIILVAGVDFYIENDTLFIKKDKDPFNGSFASRDIITDNTQDKELILWCCDTLIDRKFIFNHFGYVINKSNDSSSYYKDIVNKVWDMHVSGSPVSLFESMVSTILKLPTVVSTGEVVEQITTDYYTQDILVITNKNVYRYPKNSILKEGIKVKASVNIGSCLVDTIRLYTHLHPYSLNTGDFNKEQFYKDINYILLDRGFFNCNLTSGLGINRDSVPIKFQGLDINNNPKFSFEIQGTPEDTQSFWEATWDTTRKYNKDIFSLFKPYLRVKSVEDIQGITSMPENYSGKVVDILSYKDSESLIIRTYIKLDNTTKYMDGGLIQLTGRSYYITHIDKFGVYIRENLPQYIIDTPRLGYTIKVNKKYIVDKSIDNIVGYVKPIDFFIDNFIGPNSSILVIDREKLYPGIDFFSLSDLQYITPSHGYLFIRMNTTIPEEIYDTANITSNIDTCYTNKQIDYGQPEPTNNFWYDDRIRLTKYIIECNV